MKLIKTILIFVASSYAMSLQAADLKVYWSTDGVASERVHQLAQQFQGALQQSAGIQVDVVVAKPAAVNAAVQQGQADIVITCNEVDSSHGIPLERLSQKAIEQLQCVGGSATADWSLAVNHDVERENSGEFWAYILRSSVHIAQARDLRAALQSVRDQLQVESIITASAR